MTLILHGIPNCDTVKKARKWLEANQIPYNFHDYKKAGAPLDLIESWAAEAGYEVLLNTRGTTFRALSDDDKADMNAQKAAALMCAHPSLIKRPVVTGAGALLVGFKEADWAGRLQR